MRAAIAIVIATLALNLGNGSVLAQTGDRWLYSLRMFDAQTGWAKGAEGWSGVGAKGAVASVVRTTDGGIHWRDVTPHAPPGQRIYPYGFMKVGWLTSLSAWVLASVELLPPDWQRPGTPVLFYTVDGGQTWKSVTISVGGLMDFINARDGWLVSGNDIRRSTDGGNTWIKIGSAKFPGLPPQSIAFLNATTGWITGANNGRDGTYLLVTRDGGRTWQQQKLPLPSQLTTHGLSLTEGPPKFFTAQDGILAVVYGGYKDAGVLFYVTHDGGTTWTYTTPVTLQSYRTVSGDLFALYRSSSFADSNHGWVTDGDALYVTSDGGQRWTKRQPSPPFESPVGGLDFISPQVGWATGQALFPPYLLKTVDGGRTWTPVTYTTLRQ